MTFYCFTRLIESDLLFSRIIEVALLIVLRPRMALFYSDIRVLDALCVNALGSF